MTPNRTRSTTQRTFQVTGALLAAVVLAGCGAASETDGTTLPVHNAQPPASPPGAESPAIPSATEDSGAASSAQPKPPPPRTSAPAEEVTRCHTSMFSGSLEPGRPGAGQRYAELVLRNTSSESCTLYGYGGMQLIGSDGAPLPTDLERTPNPGPTMIRLDPGESASSTLHWTVVPHGNERTDGPCQPTPERLDVIPPDETDSLSIGWEFGPVCGHGSIDGSAYHQ
ncbi:DUF4232 domain-containing protein [Parasphingorhabdus pacifica]